MSYSVVEQVGPFWVGDVPLVNTVLTLNDRDGNEVELSTVTGVTASSGAASIVGNTIQVAWGDTAFSVEGIAALKLTLSNESGSVTVEPLEYVVQAPTGWHTLDTARREWRDAPDSDSGLFVLLDTARVQVEAFAPTTAEGSPVPLRYKQAQLMQARNVWNAAKSDPAGQQGDDGFIIRPFPMDWTVKNIIRPKNPVPVVA